VAVLGHHHRVDDQGKVEARGASGHRLDDVAVSQSASLGGRRVHVGE
jgi:hypothetical protein